MENVKTIVKQVVKIWRLYKTQQQLLTAAMRAEISFELRKLLSRDYMICSLLKKEMANLYDGLRCCMGDRHGIRPESGTWEVPDGIDNTLGKITIVHRQILEEYAVLLDLAEDSNINTAILHQHQNQMSGMVDEMVMQSQKMQLEPEHISLF